MAPPPPAGKMMQDFPDAYAKANGVACLQLSAGESHAAPVRKRQRCDGSLLSTRIPSENSSIYGTAEQDARSGSAPFGKDNVESWLRLAMLLITI